MFFIDISQYVRLLAIDSLCSEILVANHGLIGEWLDARKERGSIDFVFRDTVFVFVEGHDKGIVPHCRGIQRLNSFLIIFEIGLNLYDSRACFVVDPTLLLSE